MVSLLDTQVQIFLAFIYLLPLGLILVFDNEDLPKKFDDTSYRLFTWAIYLGTLFSVVYLSFNEVQIGAIKSEHLRIYIVLSYLSFYMLRDSYNPVRAFCLAIMLNFMNSYYWEFPYHLASILQYGIYKNDIQQLLHLYPAIYLSSNIRFHNRRRSLRLIIAGAVILVLIFMIRFNFKDYFEVLGLHDEIMILSRCLGSTVLTIAFYTTEKIKKVKETITVS